MTHLFVALLIVSVLILGFIAAVFLRYLMRGNDVQSVRLMGIQDRQLDAGDRHFVEDFKLLTYTVMYPGNDLEILLNGEQTYPALLDELKQARELITWHVFWHKPGQLSDDLHEILCERARAGVTVLMLLDWIGAHGIGDDYIESLRKAGVEVSMFRPPRWSGLYKIQARLHMRAVVIDRKVGFTGGFGIDDRWKGDGRHPGQWRDTNVRVHGPIVDQLQAAFATNWAEATGELLVGSLMYHPDNREVGQTDAGVMHTAPTLGSTNAERFFMLSIAGARKHLYITNAYFLPSHHLRKALTDAAARGVDVRVLSPGANTDRKSTWYAARLHYDVLLEGGVRIFEYRPTMVHAKTMVVDETWCCIGTMNFDNRSMNLNDEVAMVARDDHLGQQMKEIFERDLELADEVTLEEHRRRSRGARLKELLAKSVAPLL